MQGENQEVDSLQQNTSSMEHMDGAGRRKDRKQWKLNPYRIIIKKKDSRREGIIQANCNMCLSVKLEQHCWRRALSAGLPSECWAQQEASSLQPPPTVTTSRDRCHHPGCIYHREVPHSAGTQRAGSTWCRCDYCPNGPTWPTGHSTHLWIYQLHHGSRPQPGEEHTT